MNELANIPNEPLLDQLLYFLLTIDTLLAKSSA